MSSHGGSLLKTCFVTGDMTTSSSCLPTTIEDEVDNDEPPEHQPLHFSKIDKARKLNSEFKKHTVRASNVNESLLTKAIATDSDSAAVSKEVPRGRITIASPAPCRALSNASLISSASVPSTADLTSDGGLTSPSRTSTPSPPPPNQAFGLGLMGFALPREHITIKGHSDDDEVKHEAPTEVAPRKRCITFACKNVSKPTAPIEPAKEAEVQTAPVKRPCMLKFACSRRDEDKPAKRLGSPPPPVKALRKSAATHTDEHHRRDSTATIVNSKPSVSSALSKLTPSVMIAENPSASELEGNKFHEFASSVDDNSESWMTAPKTSTSLMKVDCLLEKERRIQKLSKEVDDEVALEEDEDDEDDASDDGYMEDDEEDDEEDEDEEDIWSNDGNDSDEDESDHEDYDYDQKTFNLPMYSPRAIHSHTRVSPAKPLCCRVSSDSSFESPQINRYNRPARARPLVRSATPDLPDSTDFVPGTFDEDKAKEEAYVSCLEERKLAKKIITPQDIDPSFPTSDPEDDDEPTSLPAKTDEARGRDRKSSNASRHSVSPSPHNANKAKGSPAPVARRVLRSPPPLKRVGSRALSPMPTRTRSPLCQSPVNQTGPIVFNSSIFARDTTGIARTKSLPRPSVHPTFLRRRTYQITTSTSPKPTRAMKMRGAVDIVEGLKRKRLRRKEKHYSKCGGKPKEWRAEAGEGVERMRELGLLNKERIGGQAPNLMLSV